MNQIFSLLAIILFSFNVVVQAEGEGQGSLTGTVQDQTNQETIPFANVIVSGTNIGVTTDFDGKYELNLEAGTYTIIISYIGYKTDTIANIEVITGQTVELTHKIRVDSQVLESIDLVVKQDRESETALLVTARKSTEIVQNIGAQELSRKGISTVADGLKKVSGISTVSSKFVVVRGLGDRYNAALLNGLPVPSTNPDMKVPELDLFPTNIVSNIKVTKTFSSQYYGDYSGGIIDIQTKSYSENPELKVSIGSGFNSQTIGRNVTSYNGGRFDYFGFDDGTRATPNIGSKNSETGIIQFNNLLNPISKVSGPNSSFNISKGNCKLYENGSKFGYLMSLSHSQDAKYTEGNIRVINKQNDVKLDYEFENFEQSTNSSALATLYFAPNTQSAYKYTFVGVNTSSDATREIRGNHFDYPSNIYSRRNTFQRNTLYLQQLSGTYDLEKANANWAVGYSVAENSTPDRNQLVYLYEDGAADNEYIFNAKDRLENHRFSSELTEKELSGLANIKYYLNGSKIDKEKAFIDFGIQGKYKVRNFDYTQFLYDLSNFGTYYAAVDYNNPDQYLNDMNAERGAISIEEVSNPASAYRADLMVIAGHANASVWFGPRLQLLPGLRSEYAIQNITYKNQVQPSINEVNSLNSLAILPHLGLRFNATEKTVFRFASSKTISRPGFKEVAPFEYTEVFAGTKTKGNPELQNGQNYNADLKMEFYPNPSELISVAVFGKYLDNPIEKNMLATASGQLQSFQNADFGMVAGIELEYNKKLATIFKKGILKDMTVGFNASILHSNVQVNDDGNASNLVTNKTHSLQGASPVLLNVDLSYNPGDKGIVTVAYNWFGDRLSAIGIQGLGDIYEQSFGSLNLIGSYNISDKLKASAKVKNLLNPVIETVQYNEGVPFTTNSFKKGLDGSISLTFMF